MSDDRIPCESCGGPMSTETARCPHCGARQSRAPSLSPRPAKDAPPAPKERPVLREVSKAEAKAILAVQAAKDGGTFELSGGEPNILEWMFLPDSRSTGGSRIAEIVLTVLSLPVLLAGSVCLIFMFRRVRRARRQGSVAAGRLLATVGSLILGSSVFRLDLSVFFGCVLPIFSVVGREVVRWRSQAKHKAPDLLAGDPP